MKRIYLLCLSLLLPAYSHAGFISNPGGGSGAVLNNQSNTYSTGAQDFGSATSLKVPTSAGAAPTASGLVAYDSTSNTLEAGVNGVNVQIETTARYGVASGYLDLDSNAQFKLGHINQNFVTTSTSAPGAGAGLSDYHLWIHRNGSASELYVCPGLGANCNKTHANSAGWAQINGNSGSATAPDGGGPVNITGAAPLTTTATDGSPDTLVMTTSMSTGKLIGRSTAGTGVMEEITVGTGLTLSSGTLSNSGGSHHFFFGCNDPAGDSNDHFLTIGPYSIGDCGTTESVSGPTQVISTRTGTIQRLFVLLNAATAAGTTFVVTVRKNGVGTAVTCTVASEGTSCNDTANTAAITAGDLLSIGYSEGGAGSDEGMITAAVVVAF